MKVSLKSKLELMDINIPELFITNYMNNVELIDIKVYLYLCYILNNNIEIDNILLCKKLNINESDLSFSLERLEACELITKSSNGYIIINLKEKEIDKLYTPILKPKMSKEVTAIEQARTLAATSISDSFFGGLMSFSWYTDIGIIFDKYKFNEEVMIALFHYCNERKALNKQYVYKVAESWFKGSVKTFEDLENYLENYNNMNIIMQKISKALRLSRNLTKYEENYVATWVNEYKYDFKIIEEALKRTVNKSNPSISYINGILKNWFAKGYKVVTDIKDDSVKTKTSDIKYKNYDQRKYNDLESFYDNMK